MEVLQTAQNLAGKRLRDLFVEPTMLPQTTRDRTTRDVLQEAAKAVSRQRAHNRGDYLHAQERRRLLEAEVLHDVRMVQVLEGLALEL